MIQTPDISTLTNVLGLLFSLSAMAIVATAARPLAGIVRRGMMSMLWGLALIAVSFLITIFGLGDHTQMTLLALGMVMILVASHQLFKLYQPDGREK